MGDLRFAEGVAAGLLLESAVGAGEPVLVLTQMLGPGADEVGLDEPGGFAAVAEQLPAQGAVRLRERPTWPMASLNATELSSGTR